MRSAVRVGLAKLGTPGLRCICSKARGVAFDLCPTVPILIVPGSSTDCARSFTREGSPTDPRTSSPNLWLCLQSMGVDSVRNLLGQNLGDLQKARNHPNIILWKHSHNMSDLSELGLDSSPTLAYVTNRPPNTAYPPSNLIHSLDLPGSDDVSHSSGMVHTPCSHPLHTPGCPYLSFANDPSTHNCLVQNLSNQDQVWWPQVIIPAIQEDEAGGL